jgi:hypothetical protein
MRSLFYVLLLSVVLFGCEKKASQKTLVARPVTDNENFNQFSKDSKNVLSIFQTKDSVIKKRADRLPDESYHVKFRDTAISIQLNADDKNAVADTFSFAEFLNSQKTSLLVQVADNSGLVAPFYVLTLKDNQLEAVSLYKASKGKEDKKYTNGLDMIGRSAYLINNDYVLTGVNAKLYTIKRKNPEERIQGKFFINSPDKATLVFMLPSAMYEVHYPTGTVFSQPLPAKVPSETASLYKWIQNNYSWQRDQSGISFLKENIDDNRIINIEDF